LRRLLVVAAIVIVAWLWPRARVDHEPLRFATFNIELFPQSELQIVGAFEEIAKLDVGFVAVQEIGDAERFAREAKRRLGSRWELVLRGEPHGYYPGVLFDSSRWRLLSARLHDETRLGAQYLPTLEVRMRRGDSNLRVLVVHLKSGTPGRDVRKRQLRALAEIIRDVARANEPIVVLGDFNATEDGDRTDIAALARDNHLVWATEPLACTAFWRRSDGCPRSRLDHVLTWAPPKTVAAAGACASHGCGWEESCPLYVSDHCPVVVTF